MNVQKAGTTDIYGVERIYESIHDEVEHDLTASGFPNVQLVCLEKCLK